MTGCQWQHSHPSSANGIYLVALTLEFWLYLVYCCPATQQGFSDTNCQARWPQTNGVWWDFWEKYQLFLTRTACTYNYAKLALLFSYFSTLTMLKICTIIWNCVCFKQSIILNGQRKPKIVKINKNVLQIIKCTLNFISVNLILLE